MNRQMDEQHKNHIPHSIFYMGYNKFPAPGKVITDDNLG